MLTAVSFDDVLICAIYGRRGERPQLFAYPVNIISVNPNFFIFQAVITLAII